MMTRHPPMSPQLPRRVTWLSSSSLLLVLWLAVSSAQQFSTTLTPDGTLGTTVTPNGNVYTIAGGTRPGNGPNLFHSFDRFSIGTGATADFKGPAGIVNILSRVTGGQQSEIDGTLRSTTPGVHLYLLNPSGVMFGPNATLDVQGSFHVSTADYLRLADGARFFARLSEQSTLSVAPPVAFGFLGPTPERIMVNGSTLQVPSGETFSLIGGDITIAGNPERPAAGGPTLGAPGGRIHLVSVGAAGEVVPPPAGQPLDLEGGAVTNGGKLDLSQGALVTVSSEGRQHAGEVAVRAGTLTLTGGAEISGSTVGEGHGGRVTVVANDVHIENGRMLARTTSRGNSGEITVRAGTLTLTGGAEISGSTVGEGHGGRVTVVANDVHIENGQISVTASSGGAGGEITVEAGMLTLTGRVTPIETFPRGFGEAQISGQTKGEGHGGRVTIVARDVRLENSLIRTRTCGTEACGGKISGNSGKIAIQTDTLTLTEMAEINGSSVGAGHGGNITVVARKAIKMVGSPTTAPGIASDALRAGAAGRVDVYAPTVLLNNGRIQAIGNETSSGLGGEVVVQGDTVTLIGGARISSSAFGAGQGGHVTVAATEAIRITGEGSMIASEAQGSGDAGRIDVAAPTVRLEAGGSITAAAVRPTATAPPNPGKGGEITVQAGMLTLSGGGRIRSSTNGDGGGGNVTVRAREATITGGAQISSSSGGFSMSLGQFLVGRGAGGNVTISATEALTIAGQNPTGTVQSGVVSQTFGAGIAGRVIIITPRLTMAEGGRIGTDTGGDGRAGDIVAQVGSGALASGAQISSRSGFEANGTLRVGTGLGGTVTLTATEGVTLAGQGSGLSASTAGQGRGGNIVVQAQQVQLTEGAAISAQSTSTGDAGTVTIQGPGGTGTFATQVTLTGSVVATEASVAGGGNIQVRVQDTLRLRDSQITTAVRGGEGRGGDIRIDPEFVILERSQIRANAFGGPGGNVRIVAQGFVADAASQVSASSVRNVEGRIDIQAATTPSGLVAPLPLVFASAAALLRSPCAARLHEGTVSTLVERGRAGVPATPDGVLPSRLPLAPLDTATPTPDGGLPSAALASPLEGGQHNPSGSLPLQGWAAPASALRLLGECASR